LDVGLEKLERLFENAGGEFTDDEDDGIRLRTK